MLKAIPIIGQNQRQLILPDHIAEVSVGDNGVFVVLSSGEKHMIASYDNREESKYAVQLYLGAILDEEQYFEFPHKRDVGDMMSVAKQHGAKITSRKVSHGHS